MKFFTEEARSLLAKLHAERQKGKTVLITLEGPLGAGKTTFVKSFLELVGVKPEDVQSPTFLKVLEHRLPSPGQSGAATQALALHLDAYRVDDIKEFERMGLESYGDQDLAFVLVEWPEKFMQFLETHPQMLSIWNLSRVAWALSFSVQASADDNALRKLSVQEFRLRV